MIIYHKQKKLRLQKLNNKVNLLNTTVQLQARNLHYPNRQMIMYQFCYSFH